MSTLLYRESRKLKMQRFDEAVIETAIYHKRGVKAVRKVYIPFESLFNVSAVKPFLNRLNYLIYIENRTRIVFYPLLKEHTKFFIENYIATTEKLPEEIRAISYGIAGKPATDCDRLRVLDYCEFLEISQYPF
jgi:hypothetical protein